MNSLRKILDILFYNILQNKTLCFILLEIIITKARMYLNIKNQSHASKGKPGGMALINYIFRLYRDKL